MVGGTFIALNAGHHNIMLKRKHSLECSLGEMPLGKYKNFASCVAAKSKTMGKAAAKRYCGKIYYSVHKKKKYGRGK